ncbi:hypothetical protein MJO28_017677 [Puccinia striiformis f. sp. tritici]|nr:hypothetical protein MJO28_017677 [Puccinia striiformis f. sp. tritici]
MSQQATPMITPLGPQFSLTYYEQNPRHRSTIMFKRVLSLQAFLLAATVFGQQLPSPLQSPAALGLQLKAQFAGSGNQIYKCVASSTGSTWVSAGAEAQLQGSGPTAGQRGHHYFENGKPVFNLNTVGRVDVVKVAEAPAPSGPGDVKWLELRVVSGPFRAVYRTQSQGGVPRAPPSNPCSQQYSQVPYSATYSFYA